MSEQQIKEKTERHRNGIDKKDKTESKTKGKHGQS